jgi:ubiquinone/menaquinone biosynthesis C-methylase UbiE
MESKVIDPVDFREAQHKHWDSAAVGWKEWSDFNDSADRHISERLVELADVQPGSRVLDVAAGYGEPALTAARKAGRRAALWPRTSPPRCSRSGVNARRRPV